MIPLNKHKTPTVSFADKDVTDEFIEYHSYKYHQTNMLGVLTRNVWCIDIDINHADGEMVSKVSKTYLTMRKLYLMHRIH